MNVDETKELQEIVKLLTEKPIIDHSKVKDIYEIAKKLRTGLQFAYFKVKWGLQKCDISTCERMIEQKLEDYKNYPNKERIHLPFHVSPIPPSKNGFTDEKAKAVFEILDSLVKRPKSSSSDINDSTDNINHYNNKRINTRKRHLNNNDRISSTTESASLSSFDASSLEQTLPPFFPIEVNPNSIELYLNSLERNYGAYGNNNNHHSWTLMNYGSPTIKNSSLSSSHRRKVDWGEDSNRAIKNQKIQKTTVGTPPNQIRSINDMKTPDTAFSLSEYLNMSPMQ
ncbi:15249_t:CDS:2 [Entrophospora sp. SA101]|nr:17196_t:CDS:2 [Entrophospora sp. SA101]CAJ0914048.1 15249_t:CDS:2 [Entrophospora sp. SA101]